MCIIFVLCSSINENQGMIYSSEAEISSIVAAFEDCTLPRDRWTHAAHLTIALWYLTQNPSNAVNLIRNHIQQYNLAHSIESTPTAGYHETITLFWIYTIQKFLLSVDSSNSFLDLTNQLVNHYADPNYLFEYYSSAHLFSPQARFIWTEPNLKPL